MEVFIACIAEEKGGREGPGDVTNPWRDQLQNWSQVSCVQYFDKKTNSFLLELNICVYTYESELEIAVVGWYEDWKNRTALNPFINTTPLASGQFLHNVNHQAYVHKAIILYH